MTIVGFGVDVVDTVDIAQFISTNEEPLGWWDMDWAEDPSVDDGPPIEDDGSPWSCGIGLTEEE